MIALHIPHICLGSSVHLLILYGCFTISITLFRYLITGLFPLSALSDSHSFSILFLFPPNITWKATFSCALRYIFLRFVLSFYKFYVLLVSVFLWNGTVEISMRYLSKLSFLLKTFEVSEKGKNGQGSDKGSEADSRTEQGDHQILWARCWSVCGEILILWNQRGSIENIGYTDFTTIKTIFAKIVWGWENPSSFRRDRFFWTC